MQTWEHACQAKDTYQESKHSSMQVAYSVPNPTVRLVQAPASYVCTYQHKIFLKLNIYTSMKVIYFNRTVIICDRISKTIINAQETQSIIHLYRTRKGVGGAKFGELYFANIQRYI